MSLNLRPPGKPCLRSLQGTLTVVVGVVALATAPAAIAQQQRPLAWFDAEAGVPETVDFADVAADGPTVVAVGRTEPEPPDEGEPPAEGETVAPEEAAGAAIYRWDGSAWAAELIQSESATVALTDVAILGAEEWAVGTSAAGPLVLRRAAGGWVEQDTPVTHTPTAIAIRGTTVFIGDSKGSVHRIPIAGGAGEGKSALGAGAIEDISLHGNDTGFAVAMWSDLLKPTTADDTTARIYALAPDPQPQVARADSAQVDMLGVSAASAAQAVAIDSKATWRLQDGKWVHEPALAATRLNGVTALPELTSKGERTGYVYEFVAGAGTGDETTPPRGAVWQRRRLDGRYEPWQPAALPTGTAPLTGVAATGPESAWAVGEAGTVLRFWRKPPTAQELADAEARQAALDAQQQQQQPTQEEAAPPQESAGAEENAPQEQAPAEEPPAEESAGPSAAPPPPPPPPAPVERDRFEMNGIVIDDSTAPKPGRRDTGQRLLKNVKAVRKGRKLIVSFRLTTKARVALTAKRGRRVVARTRMRTLRKGRRTLVLRFRGRPPSSLKVTVRRVSGRANTR